MTSGTRTATATRAPTCPPSIPALEDARVSIDRENLLRRGDRHEGSNQVESRREGPVFETGRRPPPAPSPPRTTPDPLGRVQNIGGSAHNVSSFACVADRGNSLYQTFRAAREPEARMAAFRKQSAMADAVPVPQGVLEIPNPRSAPVPCMMALYAELALYRARALEAAAVAAVRAALGESGVEPTARYLTAPQVEACLRRCVDDLGCTWDKPPALRYDQRQAAPALKQVLAELPNVLTVSIPHNPHSPQHRLEHPTARLEYQHSPRPGQPQPMSSLTMVFLDCCQLSACHPIESSRHPPSTSAGQQHCHIAAALLLPTCCQPANPST